MAIAMLFLTLPEGAILSMLVELCKKDLLDYSSIKSSLSPFPLFYRFNPPMFSKKNSKLKSDPDPADPL
jgi:hypothetical protein